MKAYDPEEINRLADKWMRGRLTPDEKTFLDDWFLAGQDQSYNWSDPELSEEQMQARLFISIQKRLQRRNANKTIWQIASAAIIFMICGISAYLYYSSDTIGTSENVIINDIAAGSKKAILTVAGGQKYMLTTTNSGQSIKQEGVRITRSRGGDLIYTAEKNSNTEKTIYNTLETPAGGHIALTLPDGTGVHLNAGSRLSYPTVFTGKQRKVKLYGEAYFKVTKNKSLPFIVETAGQAIEVLGTQFNVHAFDNEPATKTTLAEGSVLVTSSNRETRVLKPGQQSIVNNGMIRVAEVDVETVTAWKDGDFIFKGDDFRGTMREIARWYDVDIFYEKDVPEQLKLGGWVKRSKNISSVLNVISLSSNIHFIVEGTRVTVKL